MYSLSFKFQASLAWCLYGVALEHVTLPLANFSMTLPAEWGMPLGWSLTLIPILLTIAGLLWHLFGKQILGSLGIPFKMVIFDYFLNITMSIWYFLLFLVLYLFNVSRFSSI